MGNSAGVNGHPEPAPDQTNEGERSCPQTRGGESQEGGGAAGQIEWDEIPIDYSESPSLSRMSGHGNKVESADQGSQGDIEWCPHDRYYKKHHWYSKKRAWPRASERDREFEEPPDKAIRSSGIPCTKPMPQLDPRRLENGLHVTDVNLHIENNTARHHTNMYQCTGSRRCHPSRKHSELVIRRGDEFLLTLILNKRCDIRRSDLTLIFNLGDVPKFRSGLNVSVKVDTKGDKSYIPRRWGASCISQDEKTITLSVYVPPSAAVGEWEFSVTTVAAAVEGKPLVWQYNHNQDINVIFNPWCKDDSVYMEDEKWRKEAVLNDSGCYYHGNSTKMAASPWFYAQFEDGILEAAFHLLRKGWGYKTTPCMANPSSVARVLASMINADDEHGVMKWGWEEGGGMEEGTAPTKWKGSDKIIRQYMASRETVRYGHCWVFAGLLTTVCRALGIPSRTVTNYMSGQNTDTAQLSIDYFMVRDAHGDWTETSDDSIWVFHVWCEIWTKRRDLDETGRYDGWQAVDPTPLQRSDGVYSVGPSPVRAIKEGSLGVEQDTAAMFSQVNADKVVWREDERTGRLVETRRLRNVVGKMISTHEPTGRPYRGASIKTHNGRQRLERLDLTDTYKYREGSEQERNVVENAERKFHLSNACLRPNSNNSRYCSDHDVDPRESIDVKIAELGDVFVGSDFQFKVYIENRGSRARDIGRVDLKVFYKTYSGAKMGLAEFGTFRGFDLHPGEREEVQIEVSSRVARARPRLGFHLDLQTVVELRDREYVITERQPFLLRRPNIKLKGPSRCGKKEEIEVEVLFHNPLCVPLTECEVDIEGSLACLEPTEDTYRIPNIAASGTWKTVLFLKPKPHPIGKQIRDLSLVLESAELTDVIGYYAVTIE